MTHVARRVRGGIEIKAKPAVCNHSGNVVVSRMAEVDTGDAIMQAVPCIVRWCPRCGAICALLSLSRGYRWHKPERSEQDEYGWVERMQAMRDLYGERHVRNLRRLIKRHKPERA